jgi:hypothetical protein
VRGGTLHSRIYRPGGLRVAALGPEGIALVDLVDEVLVPPAGAAEIFLVTFPNSTVRTLGKK